ncbi:uncharacterized protein [Coffea arabica]|uniref:Retrotransposon gag domain-containing protein n=1 Tax=Coffea arabica TaxID=13443 RepID=A0ABM4U634_COFAR
MANNQTLRELAAPELTHQPLCITFPTLAENIAFELKSGLIHLLPSFHGLSGEEPHKHVKEFEMICSSMKPPRVTEEQIRLRVFSFFLKDAVKNWLYYLPAGSIITWMPQHQISEQLLIQYFYEGLQSYDRSISDAASGEALANKTPWEAWELIESMAENSQQFDFRESNPTRRVNKAETSSIQQQLSELTSTVRQLAIENTQRAKPDTRAGMKDMETRMSQMATAINRLESHVYEKLPSQPEANPKNVSAMTLRSGKEVEDLNWKIRKAKVRRRQKRRLKRKDAFARILRLEKTKKVEKEKELLDMFRKVEINIPLLDAIKQIPKYAKFLKDLCTHKRKLRGDERVAMGESVSAILQRKLPSKCGDPGIFTIPCKMGGTPIRKAMLDLGASINVMPKTIYASLNLGSLKGTSIIIQLADRTNTYPEGLVEDILIQVNELVFPTDFYVLNMGDERSLNSSPILLGRPFLSTARIKIDVNEGILSIEFDGEIANFNIFDAMKYLEESNSVFTLSVIEPLVQETFELDGENVLEVVLAKHLELGATLSVEINDELYRVVETLHSLPPISSRYEIPSVFVPETQMKLLHSVVQAPDLEFKPLPKHLKYAFLGDKETLPVIISAHLSPSQEDNIIRLLRDHKEVIGWSIADIKGISLSLCMHRIRLEDDAKPVRQV